ncbi:MAG: hypothetical protein HYY06_31165 [Deltaproteobacteria bacterium]|nr:hypothetical protein [Deltaproteobacteria bacterium]
MLVTLLVLTSATAIGIVAAFSTSSEVRTSANVRGASQAEYVSDLTGRFGREISQMYVPHMNGGPACAETQSSRLFLTDFVRVDTMGTGTGSDVVAPNVGAFGYTPVWPYASITFDDIIERPVEVAGEQINDPQFRPVECRFRMTVDGSTVGRADATQGLNNRTVTTQRMRAFIRVNGQ